MTATSLSTSTIGLSQLPKCLAKLTSVYTVQLNIYPDIVNLPTCQAHLDVKLVSLVKICPRGSIGTAELRTRVTCPIFVTKLLLD